MGLALLVAPATRQSQEIAHGTATTKPDGSFDVKFTAKPDSGVAPKDEPTFRYTIYADVTDTTGETQVTIIHQSRVYRTASQRLRY